jgi:ferredoxin
MKMNLCEPTHFHQAGETRDRTDAAEPRLRSALLAAYRDLSTLRYDHPLVLVEGDPGGAFVRSLSDLVDEVLREIAPRGAAGERLRQHVLQLEARVRALVAQGARGSLRELWDLAGEELLCEGDEAPVALLEEDLLRAREALSAGGRVADCDDEMPYELLKHAWTTIRGERTRAPLEEIGELVAKLTDILTVDDLKSAEARSPQRLKASVGARYDDAFDFEAWSRLLEQGPQPAALPESRRRRIRSARSVLASQRFFALPGAEPRGADRPAPHSFVFDGCAGAIDAYRERTAEMVELVKAIAIAELEIGNGYREPEHDAFFAHFDETSLEPDELAQFPPYLVCLRAKECTARENARILELLSSGLPIKVLVQTGDLMPESSLGDGRLALGAGSARLASMAVALDDTYVLQSASSSLYQLKDRIREAITHPGPALVSVFTGSAEKAPDLPGYLRSAIATQSRAFPSFSFDPRAGDDWATRFRIEDNPQPEIDWPLERLEYEDEDLQRISQDVAFTFVDFAAADRRYARHLSRVPRSDWHADMVEVGEYLGLCEEDARGKVPYVLMVDEGDVLQRLVVDRALIRSARRCAEAWRRLQELCGIRDSRARQLLEQERAAWEREREVQAAPAEVAEPAEPGEAPLAEAGAASPPDEEVVPDSDEPYIETPRCTTCDECTQRNPRMFAYDENKQAYIVDPDAGTFRDLVEAAESCQVAIIHPGVPRNPQEPGLAELVERAAAFR